jgi:hypothetical protein
MVNIKMIMHIIDKYNNNKMFDITAYKTSYRYKKPITLMRELYYQYPRRAMNKCVINK